MSTFLPCFGLVLVHGLVHFSTRFDIGVTYTSIFVTWGKNINVDKNKIIIFYNDVFNESVHVLLEVVTFSFYNVMVIGTNLIIEFKKSIHRYYSTFKNNRFTIFGRTLLINVFRNGVLVL